MSVYIGAATSAMRGPCPEGFHVPLNTEWQAVKDIWTALGGGSSDGPNFGIALKLPFAGFRDYNNASVSNQGTYGRYWSSSPNSSNAKYAYYLSVTSSAITPQSSGRNRANGFSVRCFKDTPTIPTSSWTKLYGTSVEAGGIFWSSADGLISLSSDGQTWVTITDKNLGATTVWNSGDTLSEANCGKYYQRGNNYGFARTGSVTTSSTQVDASSYGPGNYYSSSTFIIRDGDWSFVQNDNLRGGQTGAQQTPKELKSAYIGDWPNAGIYHNASLGLITFKKGAYKYTFADKNLGATSTDVTSSASYGYYFQFGNNHGRTSRPSSRSASQIDGSSYGPGNYYNSSTFHTVSDGNNPTLWDNSGNLNLWGDTTNTYEARQGPCPSGWHIPSWTEVYDIFWEIWNRHNIKTKEGFRQCLLMPQPGWLAYNDGTVIDVGDVGVWMTTQRGGISGSHIGRFHSAGWDGTAGSAGYGWRTNCGNTAQIRPFKNGYVEPDETWTLLLDMS